jgi:hypothetical protein
MLRVIIVIVAVGISGCLVFPTFHEEPYQEEEFVKVQPGKTSREVVVELYGQPDAIRENGAIWVYSEVHRVGMWLVLEQGQGFFHDFQYLIIEFEQDIVSHFELVENVNSCTSTYICIRENSNSEYLTPSWGREDIIASRREDDRLAKEFRSIPGMCVLYIYFHTRSSVHIASIDTFKNASIDTSTYLHVTLDPGTHRLHTNSYKFGFFDLKEKEIDIRCEREKLVFVELNRSGFFLGNYDIRIVDEERGRFNILKRDLILLP